MTIVQAATIPDAWEKAAFSLLYCGDYYDKSTTQGIDHFSHDSVYLYCSEPSLSRFSDGTTTLPKELFSEFFLRTRGLSLDNLKDDFRKNGSASISQSVNLPHMRFYSKFLGGGVSCHISMPICDIVFLYNYMFIGNELLFCLVDKVKQIGHISVQVDTLFVESFVHLKCILDNAGERLFLSASEILDLKSELLREHSHMQSPMFEKYMNCDV